VTVGAVLAGVIAAGVSNVNYQTPFLKAG